VKSVWKQIKEKKSQHTTKSWKSDDGGAEQSSLCWFPLFEQRSNANKQI
jgi:hypothetical protein